MAKSRTINIRKETADKIEEIVMEIKDTNLVKRPRGRPKGSKNKNKS